MFLVRLGSHLLAEHHFQTLGPTVPRHRREELVEYAAPVDGPEAVPDRGVLAEAGLHVVRPLRERFGDRFERESLDLAIEQTVSIPYQKHGVLAELRDRLQVVREEYGDEVSVTVRGTPEALGKLAARLSGG